MRGIEPVKKLIQKIIFTCMDPKIGLAYSVKTPADKKMDGYLNLTACNEKLDVTVIFNNGTKQSFNINMCEKLGW
jgi:hypothetical protein